MIPTRATVPVLLAMVAGCASTAPAPQPAAPGPAAGYDFRAAERPILTKHVQLTFPDRFSKAGENYFSPDDRHVIFQAVEQPTDGSAPSDFYAMFVADVVRSAGGDITGIANVRRLSPPGSANTCGWFHPTDPNRVIFGTTLEPPSNRETPGYQRGTGKYRWQFPPEMRIVEADLRTADGTAKTLRTIAGDGNGYVAEGSISPDGRTLLYTRVDPETQGDLWTMDMPTGRTTCILKAPGYDGGPFFTPDGKGIVYRSDRKGDSLLQVFVADLAFGPDGSVTGMRNERPMTADGNVNWCPYFHPDGRHFVYGSSAAGHSNYEVFMRDAGDPSKAVRITNCPGADVLPAFTRDGRWMIWTAQRGDGPKSSQVWVARFDVDAAARAAPFAPTADAK